MDGEITRINERAILAQYGPMTLTIQAWDSGGPDIGLAARAGEFAFSILPRIAGAREIFRRGSALAERPLGEPILESMRKAVEKVGQPDLGPMAAVAGAVSDEVINWLVRAGAVKAIVENGGDISLYLEEDQKAVVGIRARLEDAMPVYSLELSGAGRRHWGVATSSGLGGRGLSRGLAEAAVCVAESGIMADAAATAVANSCFVESLAVKMLPAEALDPDTDIPGIMVTAGIGDLSEKEVETALDNSLRYAQSLVDREILLGSYVFFRGGERLTLRFAEKVAPLVKIQR